MRNISVYSLKAGGQMNKYLSALFFIMALWAVPATAQRISDDDIRKMMIDRSIAEYPGNCPCPYNLARNGSRCGGRSAYSRPGGASPLCYPTDITPKMLEEQRRRKGL
jgi:hypothetical protein